MKLYHSTPTVNRDGIRKSGLLLEPIEGEAIRSLTGGFFFSSKLPEQCQHIDVWEVDTQGLPVEIGNTEVPPDPEDKWWVVYGRKVIEPWRLRLLGSAEHE
jgi:hypothetical protein